MVGIDGASSQTACAALRDRRHFGAGCTGKRAACPAKRAEFTASIADEFIAGNRRGVPSRCEPTASPVSACAAGSNGAIAAAGSARNQSVDGGNVETVRGSGVEIDGGEKKAEQRDDFGEL